MAVELSPDLVEWWASPAGEAVVATAGTLSWTPADSLSSTTHLRCLYPDLPPELLSGTIDLIQARHRAVEKLGPETAHWFLSLAAVQQATPHAVAHYRAQRLFSMGLRKSGSIHDATCSIGTELAALRAAGATSELSGSDTDPARLAMARHNVPTAAFTIADCLMPCWDEDAVTLLDPARRTATGQRRYRGPDSTIPSLTTVLETYRYRPYLVKCAPGIDWETLFTDGWGTGPWQGEVEIISIIGSREGGVKEAALWSACLCERTNSAIPVSRRATVLNPQGDVVDQIADDPAATAAAADVTVDEVGSILIEPDGAIVRAGLVRQWAARSGLWQLDHRIAHLTGDQAPAGVPYYPVIEQLRYRTAELKKALRRHPTSSLEILVRGVDVDPTAVRRAILPKPVAGAPARTLVISRVGTSAVAFLCGARLVG
ncbi:hypothetical protein [Lawsonella clevelandensis]|uniref:THUMP-like domain-containing protein n=1 Tax=Lawsonella clevelandensis TaxID=1528099 RepID=UPI0006B548BB|nr:hypothetical protein [Lawsonella clevelandensis]MDU7193649.1 class I SAM-dependent methyltransferase [Lawsonella clevelandensis]